jgi:hypothetical protein
MAVSCLDYLMMRRNFLRGWSWTNLKSITSKYILNCFLKLRKQCLVHIEVGRKWSFQQYPSHWTTPYWSHKKVDLQKITIINEIEDTMFHRCYICVFFATNYNKYITNFMWRYAYRSVFTLLIWLDMIGLFYIPKKTKPIFSLYN